MGLTDKLKGKVYVGELKTDKLSLEDAGAFSGERHEVAESMSVTADVANRYFYIASQDTKVVKIKEIHGTAETTSTGTFLQVERLQGTEALGAGDDLLTDNTNAGFDLKGTADTLQTGTVVSSTAVYLSEGDRLGIVIDGATNEIASALVEVELITQ